MSLKEIKERIKKEGNIKDIVELSLEDLQLETISKEVATLLAQATNLQILALNDNNLDNIDALPKLELTVLDLSNNRINDKALIRISEFSDLGQLLLTSNEIRTLQGLKPLFKLSKLIQLDLSDNPVAQLPGYRELIFKELPDLESLDNTDRNGKEIEQSLDSDDDEELDSDQEDESEQEEEEEDQPKVRK